MKYKSTLISLFLIFLLCSGCDVSDNEITTISSCITKTETAVVSELTINDTIGATEDFATSQTVSVPATVPKTQVEMEIELMPEEPVIIRLGFAGDFKTAEGEINTKFMDSQKNGIFDCISPNLIEEIQAFDFFMLNNEFTYSTRGKKLKNKTYTFRAKPERVEILHDLGVDLVLLANNHVFDYGEEAFYDTLETLKQANIPYIGAGCDAAEASKIFYYTSDNTVISFVAATRAEKYFFTPAAKEDSPGVASCYDDELLLSLIKEAKQNSDICIASVHWGTEYSNWTEEYQREMAHSMIDVGADAIIGSHPHVLQGIEIYNNKPIIYSLGNFWFNNKSLYTGVFELSINASEKQLIGVRFIPCTQKDCYTNYPQDEKERAKILDFMKSISYDIAFDDMGNLKYDFCGENENF